MFYEDSHDLLPQPLRTTILFVTVTFVTEKNSNIASKSTQRPEKSIGKLMIESCGKKLKPAAVGDIILLNVPKVYCSPLNCPNLIGKTLKVENDVYQIGTKSGIINPWFARCDFQISGP
ncbi:hypothetical protein AVEN_251183-1 [Araneus ventricosus]|uniref:Uncharacterized protein n=1 Tax=Araneus ventricosus TaxID=182803 RepID=A0A4Y2QC42_ARAVE|nr:hypothetical protein AVEN_251183-1 [Araneus ventricosus]